MDVRLLLILGRLLMHLLRLLLLLVCVELLLLCDVLGLQLGVVARVGTGSVLRLEGLIAVRVWVRVLLGRRLIALVDGLRRWRLRLLELLLWLLLWWWWRLVVLLLLVLLLLETLLFGAVVVYPALGLVTSFSVYSSEWGPILIVLLRVRILHELLLLRLRLLLLLLLLLILNIFGRRLRSFV